MRSFCFIGILLLFAACQSKQEAVSSEPTATATQIEPESKSNQHVATFAQTIDNPSSLKDFFLIMPSRFLEGISTDKDKSKLIDRTGKAFRLDEKAGTISVSEVGQWHNQINLLSSSDDEALFAIVSKKSEAHCDSWKTSCVRYKEQNWIDVTEELIPDLSFKDFCQDLAQVRKVTELASEEKLTVEIRNELDSSKKEIQSQINFCFEQGFAPDPELLLLTQTVKTMTWEDDQFVLDEQDELWDEFITTIE